MTTTTATAAAAAAAAAATTVTDSVCRMCEGDTEKADRTDLLNEPTMWLGAQDGRYIRQFSTSAFYCCLSCTEYFCRFSAVQ